MGGAFWTAVVLDTDPPRCGLASTLRADPQVVGAGHPQQRSARELAELLRSSSILEASTGMAAFNALLEVDQAACAEVNAQELILERGAGRRVAIVGHFPLVDRVRQAAATCWVLELHPGPGDLPTEQAAVVLPQADVVALTGTTLMNHTFDDLVRLCRPEAFLLLLGPTTPLCPLLFEAGVDALSGTVVTDPTRVLKSISEGAHFRQIKRAGGVRLLTCLKHEA